MRFAYVLGGVVLVVSGWALHAQSAEPALNVRHVHIWVADVERTKAFYRDKLGMPVTAETAGQSVQFQGGQLWFGRRRGAAPADTGAITIGISASSVDAAYRTLKARGVELPQPPEAVRDEWHFVLRDPDGYAIEVEGPK